MRASDEEMSAVLAAKFLLCRVEQKHTTEKRRAEARAEFASRLPGASLQKIDELVDAYFARLATEAAVSFLSARAEVLHPADARTLEFHKLGRFTLNRYREIEGMYSPNAVDTWVATLDAKAQAALKEQLLPRSLKSRNPQLSAAMRNKPGPNPDDRAERNRAIASLVDHICLHFGFRARRNAAKRGLTSGLSESGCSIVTTALARVGVALSEDSVEDIYKSETHRKPRKARRRSTE